MKAFSSLEGAKRILNLWRTLFKSYKEVRLRTLAVVVGMLFQTSLVAWESFVWKDVGSTLTKKNVSGFYRAVVNFIAWSVCDIVVEMFMDWTRGKLALVARFELTRQVLRSYFSNNAFFQLKMAEYNPAFVEEEPIDNPDQRITNDVKDFCESSTYIFYKLTSKFMRLVIMSKILLGISPKLVTFLLGYAAFGTVFTFGVFGKKLVGLTKQATSKEADLRFGLVRVRENSESIAFYKGGNQEHNRVAELFGSTLGVLTQRLKWLVGVEAYQHAYEYVAMVLPFLVLAPQFFSGEIEYGVVMQGQQAFKTVLGCIGVIIDKFEDITSLVSQTTRVETLTSALDRASSSEEEKITLLETRPGPGIPVLELRNLTLSLPHQDDRVLCRDLSLSVMPGDRILIVGPSGAGKSSLLRAIAGLWSTGKGTVHRNTGAFFVPQEAYMTIGSLRQQLLFPSSLFAEAGTLALSDIDLENVLKKVNLADLHNKCGMDDTVEWKDVLSAGEQQRLSFARVLIQEPRLAFLDEATSALDDKNEELMYTILADKVQSWVSIGHRMSLLKYHTHVLTPAPSSNTTRKWQLLSVTRYRQKYSPGLSLSGEM